MATITSQNTSLRLFTSLKIRISDILGETITYLQETFKQSRAIFTAASPFGQLLIVFENLSQLIFYYIEEEDTSLKEIVIYLYDDDALRSFGRVLEQIVAKKA